jgi:hypothetical protein
LAENPMTEHIKLMQSGFSLESLSKDTKPIYRGKCRISVDIRQTGLRRIQEIRKKGRPKIATDVRYLKMEAKSVN